MAFAPPDNAINRLSQKLGLPKETTKFTIHFMPSDVVRAEVEFFIKKDDLEYINEEYEFKLIKKNEQD